MKIRKHKVVQDGRIVEPAIGICDACGKDVVLDHTMTNTCECGAEYNLCGQRLAPREQWGEETGETESEIMRGNLSIWETLPDDFFD